MKVTWITALLGLLTSGTLSVFITQLFNRKKSKADITEVAVRSVLAIEERAMERFHSVSDALDAAQRALDAARQELRFQERYIALLHGILINGNITYPTLEECLIEWQAQEAALKESDNGLSGQQPE